MRIRGARCSGEHRTKRRGLGRRGSVPTIIAYALPPILLTGVLAIDAARFWLAESRLQSALDAAALTAARDISSANRDNNVRAVLAANYNGGAPRHPNGGAHPATWTNVSITQPNSTQVQVQASVDVKPLLGTLNIGGTNVMPSWTTARTVTRSATANRTNTGIELALVFDTTLSMAESDGTTDGTGAKPARIEFAKRAALSLTNILYGSQQEHQPNLYISVVPFNVAINIGTQYENRWITGAAPSYSNGHSWSGCVEARRGDFHVKEDAPSLGTPDSMFRRYYWPDTYVSTETSVNTAPRGASNAHCTNHQDYSTTNVCWGNNDWEASTTTQEQNPIVKKLRDKADEYGTTQNGQRVTTSSGPIFGPNFMCPTVPILPLTMDRKTVEDRIRAMVGTAANPYPFGYGTVIATGLQGAWYTLSDSWQGRWDNPNPVRQDGTRLTPPLPLPMTYGTARMKKVVLLLSDGDNNWLSSRAMLLDLNNYYDSTSGTGDKNVLTRPESRRTELFYNAYGTLSGVNHPINNRLGISIPNSTTPPAANSRTLQDDFLTLWGRADAKLDTIMSDLCTKMKARGIVIYAVGVGVADDAHHNLLQACVSPPTTDSPSQKYIRTTNAAGLVSAFTQVANELAELRLSK